MPSNRITIGNLGVGVSEYGQSQPDQMLISKAWSGGRATDEGADHHPSFEAEQFLILSLPPIKTKHKHNVPPSGMAMEREERTVFMVIS